MTEVLSNTGFEPSNDETTKLRELITHLLTDPLNRRIVAEDRIRNPYGGDPFNLAGVGASRMVSKNSWQITIHEATVEVFSPESFNAVINHDETFIEGDEKCWKTC